jgi:hypothetical protein
MNDAQKWLEAAIALEQDILYMQAARRASDTPETLEMEIEHLKVVLSVYKKNAAAGIPWPSPDDLFCIDAITSSSQVSTSMRRDFKLAS